MKLSTCAARPHPLPTLADVVKRIDEISTLPHIALRVMEVANDPQSSALDMKSLIEADPALSARVLRCVNSSACGLRQRVSNLQQAITLLGLKRIRNLVLTASVASMFSKDEGFGSYRRRGLWQHLVAVGICSQLLAMRQRVVEFEVAFLAGLLHDIGIVFEDQHIHEDFCQVISNLDDRSTLVEIEQQRLGFDHAQLGAAIAKRWCFPKAVWAAIAFHHNSEAYRGEELQIVQCVEVANLVCTLKGLSSVGRKLVCASEQTLRALSLTRDHLSVLARDLDDELTKNATLFDL